MCSSSNSDAENSAAPCTAAESSLGNRVLGEVKKDDLITLPGKGGHSGLLPWKYMSQLGEDGEKVYSNGSNRA